MGKKKTKREILRKIEERLKSNLTFCSYNDCEPSEYMEGVNDFAKSLKKFIKKKC
jgi:hypothetical protein